MIISHKYKFIFIKCVKTAGTSIEVFLSQLCGKNDIVTPIYPHLAPHIARNYKEQGFYNHMTGLEIRKLLTKDIWNNYYKFCVERNPWDKTLSHWHMNNYRADGLLSLDEYIAKKIFCVNISKYTDIDNNVIVDKVIKYEELSQGLTEVFSYLDIPFNGSLGVRAKAEYRTCRKHYTEILNNYQRTEIEKAFDREIKLHGYRF